MPLYPFGILQVVVALTTATVAIPLGMAPQASTMRRASATTNAVVNFLCSTAGYLLLAWHLNRCATLVRRIALSVFLHNTGISAQAKVAQPKSYPVLIFNLPIAGAISVWSERERE